MEALDRFAEKSAGNLIESIRKSLEVSWDRVLYALGIRYVGETVARKLARQFPSIDELRSASYEELLEAEEVGEKIAESILRYFADPDNIRLLEKLENAGVRLQSGKETGTAGNKLEGLTIVISGTFSRHSREELKEMIEANGGKSTGSISSKTDYLLGGEGIGPAKLEKVKELGIPVISEEEFLGML